MDPRLGADIGVEELYQLRELLDEWIQRAEEDVEDALNSRGGDRMSDKWVEWDESESIWERSYYSLYNKACGFEMHLRRAYCFLMGHGEIGFGDYWNREPNWCKRCFVDFPEKTITVLGLLNRVYCWLVERRWPWFDRFDGWLLEKGFNKYLPSWWKY